MSYITPARIDWLVLMVNAYSQQTVSAAGADAVPVQRADRDQPAIAARVADATKESLAGDLWPVFAASTTSGKVDALNALLDAAFLSPRIDGEGQVVWRTSSPTEAGHLHAACAACLLEATGTYGWSRLGSCDADDCLDVYVDKARRAPRRFCSTTCLNKSKVRAFRARERHT